MISEKMLLARLEGDTIHFRELERKKKHDALFARISANSPVIADLKERLDVLKDEKELDPEYVLAKLTYQERDETTSKPHNSAAFRDMLAKFNEQKDKFWRKVFFAKLFFFHPNPSFATPLVKQALSTVVLYCR